MSTEGPPELRAVPDEGLPEAPAEAPESNESREGGGWLKVILFLAVVVACLGYLYESQRARDLETRVEALQTDLQDARAEVRAHEERMQVVRAHVGDLAGRIQLLQQAVAEPGEPGASRE